LTADFADKINYALCMVRKLTQKLGKCRGKNMFTYTVKCDAGDRNLGRSAIKSDVILQCHESSHPV